MGQLELYIFFDGNWAEAMRADERQALLDQKGCKYVPHVQWVRAETQLVIGNSDRADHNIHGYRGSIENTQFNFISAPGTTQSDVDKAFLETPTAYLVKCDIHPWMNAYVHVVTHPYHDVTSEKAVGDKKPGEYVLTDVPPGEYELFCWHEGMEEKAQVNQGQVNAYVYGRDFLAQKRVKVEPKGTVTEDFTVPAPASAR